MNYFFITGTYRSGTTLLQKILGSHEKIYSAEQPFPTLFILLKKKFLELNKIEQNIPLDHLFMQNKYSPDDFTLFLENLPVNQQILNEAFDWAATFDGVKTKELLRLKNQISANTFFNEIYQIYLDKLCKINGKKDIKVKGSKEIVTEEYIPYFIKHKTKTILIIRDIRDVINSANFGKGYKYIGKIRPTLYTIRIWRKSVAFAIRYQNNPYFLAVKYENLVTKPDETLNKIFKFLDIDQFDAYKLIHKMNSKWTANSSFEPQKGLNTDNIGRYKKNFSTQYIRYIECLTLPELLAMNYKPEQITYKQFIETENCEALEKFSEPVSVSHKAFPKNYSTNKKNLSNEINRIKVLTKNTHTDSNAIQKLFIFEQTYNFLKSKLNERS